MTEKERSWLKLDEGEDVEWSGHPKIQRLIGFKFTSYIVTNQAIYRKSGILSRSVKKIDFDKVQNISFSQGALAKLFGYGNIEISTAGGSGVEMTFRGIQDPSEVQDLINSHIKKDQKGEKSRGTMQEMLSEIKKIREAVENIEENTS